MTLIIYLVGWLIFIDGVSWALVAMHVSQHTIAIAVIACLRRGLRRQVTTEALSAS